MSTDSTRALHDEKTDAYETYWYRVLRSWSVENDADDIVISVAEEPAR